MLKIYDCPENLKDVLICDVALYNDHSNVSNSVTLIATMTEPNSDDGTGKFVSTINTAPFIDFSSDTFRRPLFGVQLWATGISAYFAYVLEVNSDWVVAKCNTETGTCNVAQGIAQWFSIFLQIVSLGLPYILLGSFSNANYGKFLRFPAIIISMTIVAMVTLFTYYNVSSKNYFWKFRPQFRKLPIKPPITILLRKGNKNSCV
jgi:hypothetical protein